MTAERNEREAVGGAKLADRRTRPRGGRTASSRLGGSGAEDYIEPKVIYHLSETVAPLLRHVVPGNLRRGTRCGLRLLPALGESISRWDCLAADGVYLGRVAVPTSFRIEEVGRGQALGVHTDVLGVQRVQLRDLTLISGP